MASIEAFLRWPVKASSIPIRPFITPLSAAEEEEVVLAVVGPDDIVLLLVLLIIAASFDEIVIVVGFELDFDCSLRIPSVSKLIILLPFVFSTILSPLDEGNFPAFSIFNISD